MAPAQFQAILDAVRPPANNEKKLPPFSTGLPNDWVAWRTTYGNIANLKNWTDDQRKAQLIAAMEGTAVRMVTHVDTGPLLWNQVLDAYGNHFLPAAQSHLAETQFQSAKQGEREAIVAWHTRLRELFSRANPGVDEENSKQLISKFVFGLAHPVVKDRTYDTHPDTYSRALEVATSKAAGVLIMRQADGLGRAGGGVMSIEPDGALLAATSGPPRTAFRESRPEGEGRLVGDGRCFKCKEFGHIKRDCPQWKDSSKRRGQRGGRGGGGGGSQRPNFWDKRREAPKGTPSSGLASNLSALLGALGEINEQGAAGGGWAADTSAAQSGN